MASFTLGFVWLLGATLTVDSGNACPTVGAVSVELERLGALFTLRQMGTAEVHVREPILQILLRDQQGHFLGVREVTSTPDCASRATLAAVMIAAWTGEWKKTQLGTPTPPAPLIAARARPETTPVASPAPTRPWNVEAGAYGFGLHDGEQAAGGLGSSVESLVAPPLLITALFEASTERTKPLGPGLAAYGFWRGGLGVGARGYRNRLFLDGTFAPLLSRLSLEGKDLQTNHHVTSWGISLGGRARLGWTGNFVMPFIFAEVSRDLARHEGTLDDRPETVTLSATNVALGLGISFRLRR